MSPHMFYRVQHDQSRVSYCPRRGFTSEKYLCGDPYDLRTSLDINLIYDFEAHCNKEHVPTSLISLCSSPHRTLDRAQTEQGSNNRCGVLVYKIYAGGWQNRDMDYFHAQDFAKEIQEVHDEKVIDYGNWEYLEDEYLVLNRIPKAAVVGVWNVQQFENYLNGGAQRGRTQTGFRPAERTRTYLPNVDYVDFENGIYVSLA
ncbi:hypothetical protein EV426DRAFT_603612 [Tirmania nivea]|nr:hypothetical protein EV426DRAFT_603612 [Tirmania nivea]